jgi:hypothetical protein
MTSYENQDRLDTVLGDAMGANETAPDFEKFCQDHTAAVEGLKKNRTARKQLHNDFFSLRFNVLSHLFSPAQIPLGVCLLLFFVILLNAWNFGPSGGGVAWAEVGRRMQKVPGVQFYEFEFKNDAPVDFKKGTYSRGSIERIHSDGNRSVDDGRKCVVTAADGHILRETESEFGNIIDTDTMASLFDVLTKGILQYQQAQLDKQKPTEVADDFLIYHFSPSAALEPWLESVVITVGRNSLLPVQMKLFYKDSPKRYSIYFFEYSAN